MSILWAVKLYIILKKKKIYGNRFRILVFDYLKIIYIIIYDYSDQY